MRNADWIGRQIKRAERMALQGKTNRAQRILEAVKQELKDSKEANDGTEKRG